MSVRLILILECSLFVTVIGTSCNRNTPPNETPSASGSSNLLIEQDARPSPLTKNSDHSGHLTPLPKTRNENVTLPEISAPSSTNQTIEPKTPQQLIIGMWVSTVRCMDASNIQGSMTFTSDGKLSIRYGANNTDCKYQFISDNEVEVTSPHISDPLKFTIQKISNMELVLLSSVQEKPERFRKANLLDAIGF